MHNKEQLFLKNHIKLFYVYILIKSIRCDENDCSYDNCGTNFCGGFALLLCQGRSKSRTEGAKAL